MGDRKKNNKYRLKRDVYISWEILESKAFKELSAMGIWVLIRFLQKRTWDKIRRKKAVYNKYAGAFTYAEAEYMGISTSQYHTILKKLIEVGFIDVEHQGGGLARDYSTYNVSERWRDYGTERFKKVEKPRCLWTGHDVRSNMERNEATGNRSCQLRETVAIGEI